MTTPQPPAGWPESLADAFWTAVNAPARTEAAAATLAFAHQLAEQIRNHDYDPGEVGPVHLTYQDAADLIDPEEPR